MTAHVVHELRVTDMLGDFCGLGTSGDAYSSAREGDHLQVELIQEIAQGLRTIAIVRQDVAAQLYAGKSKLGDLLDGLRIVATPGNCRVAEANHAWRRRNRPIKIREIGRWIKRWFDRASESLRWNSRRRGDCSQAQNKVTT